MSKQEKLDDASLAELVADIQSSLADTEEGTATLEKAAQYEKVQKRLNQKNQQPLEEALPSDKKDILLQEMSKAAQEGGVERANYFRELYYDIGGLEQYKELGIANQVDKGVIHGLIPMDSGMLVLGDPCYIQSEKNALGQDSSSMTVLSGSKKGNWVAESRYNKMADTFFGVSVREIVLYHASTILKDKDFKKVQDDRLTVDSGMVGIYDHQAFLKEAQTPRFYDDCCAICRPPMDGGILGKTFVSSTGGDGEFRYAIATQGEEIVGVKITFSEKKR